MPFISFAPRQFEQIELLPHPLDLSSSPEK
jgi:hypothetical protein